MNNKDQERYLFAFWRNKLPDWCWIAFSSYETHNSNFLNETMGETEHDAFRYSSTAVLVFAILGNILVVISILRQNNMLKSNYTTLLFYNLRSVIWEYWSFRYILVLAWGTTFWLFKKILLSWFPCKSYLSRRSSRYDVDHFSASLSCYCASPKTCHHSTEIESRFWFGVRCWFHSWLCTNYKSKKKRSKNSSRVFLTNKETFYAHLFGNFHQVVNSCWRIFSQAFLYAQNLCHLFKKVLQ